ncbi:putative tbx2 protein [Schistosoma mansoni]|uniref:putative tbx2 protein n=1 Tax=Schistosoma mansoni TaxID=6183 RepID=UPI00022DCA96|nr:putative tbx2 protein [Schistosoma mansoni]|eukprot:XP_018655362.1 putative tbx2 protein [Schistosoma mansoni]
MHKNKEVYQYMTHVDKTSTKIPITPVIFVTWRLIEHSASSRSNIRLFISGSPTMFLSISKTSLKTLRRTQDVFEIERNIVGEPEIKSLMLDLEDWFSLIVKSENILSWKNPRSTLLVIFAITILFLLVHVYEPPILFVMGCSGLLLSSIDYFGPLVLSRSLFGSSGIL